MEVFHEAPVESSYVPITEHQSQTPASFYSGPLVLYFKNLLGRILCLRNESSRHPAIQSLVKEGNTYEDSLITEDIDIWVSSEKLIFWRPSTSFGVAIPYPSIALHALGSVTDPKDPNSKIQAVYLEILVTDGFDDHDQEGTVALNFLPTTSGDQNSAETAGTATPPISTCQQLYNAITDCADLHPDPISPSSSQGNGEDDEGDEEDEPTFDYEVLEGDGMPAAFPGSGGWITSENMHQFFDEEGNWRGRGLGPGAGLVRNREEAENGVNGQAEEANGEDETKWRRTD